MKKIQTILSALLAIVLLLTACSSADGGDDSNRNGGRDSESDGARTIGEGGIDRSIIDTYRYIPETVSLPHVTGRIHIVTVHEELVYFCYAVEPAEDSALLIIVVEGISTDGAGNEVEHSWGARGIGNDIVDIYAMTDAEERGFRAIIESASVLAYFDQAVMNIIREETPRFFAGERSAADTARVLQNRVQIYLSERG
jgi:hypothetical protein